MMHAPCKRGLASRLSFFLILLSLFASAVFSNELYHFDKKNEANQFLELTQTVRCLVCQNQNIADSNAPLAADLKNKIYKMVQDRKTNNEIKKFLVDRYGEFILFEPSFNHTTIILWVFPFLGLMAGGIFVLKKIIN